MFEILITFINDVCQFTHLQDQIALIILVIAITPIVFNHLKDSLADVIVEHENKKEGEISTLDKILPVVVIILVAGFDMWSGETAPICLPTLAELAELNSILILT